MSSGRVGGDEDGDNVTSIKHPAVLIMSFGF